MTKEAANSGGGGTEKKRLVVCPECDTQVDLEEVDECPKCGLDVEKVYSKIRYDDAVAKVRKQREESAPPQKKKKKDFNPFD
jgi:rRNA maturation endonuclease Nob1